MASTGLIGSFALTETNIDANVSATIGAYALGFLNSDDVFIVKYVGRSDYDLNARLKTWIGDYKRFKYRHYSTKKAAFEKECQMFHDFRGLDNDVHPARPAGCDYDCPVSSCDDLD